MAFEQLLARIFAEESEAQRPPWLQWSLTYAQIAADIRLGIDDATAAHQLIAEFWERAEPNGE